VAVGCGSRADGRGGFVSLWWVACDVGGFVRGDVVHVDLFLHKVFGGVQFPQVRTCKDRIQYSMSVPFILS
jgi:hypothetical protein